jgi:tetratricopeptide (TPR) repeat protein
MRSPNEELAKIQQYLANNQVDSAIRLLAPLADHFPNQTVLRSKLAQLYAQTGKFDQSINSYLLLIELNPDAADTYFNLAIQYKNIGKFDEALRAYENALSKNVSGPEEIYLNMGVIYSTHQQDNSKAMECLQKSISINPNFVPALMNLANLHEETGEASKAKQIYQAVLDIDPNYGEALARLANAQRISKPDDPLLPQIKEALERPSTNVFDRVCLHYAKGKALDGLAQYGDAFRHYEQANEIELSISKPYDRSATERYFDALISAFPTAAKSSVVLEMDFDPVFICGMFRSGSTLNEQVLSGHPNVAPGGELDFIPRLVRQDLYPFPESINGLNSDRLAVIAKRYLEYVSGLHPEAKFITDKRPNNFLYLGLIKSLFPRAKIIHTTRNSLDMCLSIYFTQFGDQQAYAKRLEDIAHYFGQYKKLMTHWKSLFGDDIHDVSYDAFVVDSSAVSQNFFEFLSLDWNAKYLDFHHQKNPVKTASFEQVRQPLYARSSGRRKNYERELARLKKLFK